LTPDWAAGGQGQLGGQTAWPVAPMGEAAGPTIARSPIEAAYLAQTVSARMGLPPIDTGYEQASSAPVASAGERAAAPRLRLRMTNGKHFELAGRTSYLIGRRDSSGLIPDVDLSDFDGAAAGISRWHATIYVVGGNVFIEDLHSRNQTIRNGARLLPGQRYLLADGDRLLLGMIKLLVVLG
jgi:hypothetical protein